MQQFFETRSNGLVMLEDDVHLTYSLEDALKSELICISIRSQNLPDLMQKIVSAGVQGKTFVLCMKGIEVSSLRRLSEIAEDAVGGSNDVAVWLGPGHVQEFLAGVPNCMVIDSKSEEVKEKLIASLSGGLIRFYYGTDLIGNEVGAAAKNVIGIAAGMLDGMGLTSLKGALMSRGTREVSRLIEAMGGNGFSAYGLCLGDYEATVFSPYSHNRRFGEMFVRGEAYTGLAEGYDTVKALCLLADRYQRCLPIAERSTQCCNDGAQPKEQMGQLFTRSLKREFDN